MESPESILPSGHSLQQLDLTRLAPGMYLINIQAGDARLMKKVMIER